MGCDIHAVVEKRVSDGKWVTINSLTYFHQSYRKKGESDCAFPAATFRNYRRFAALAGVRGDGPVPRGAPDDASETATFLIDDYGSDGHSHSWLPVVDAARVFSDTEHWNEWDSDFGRKHPVSFFFGVESEDAADYRLVFWFDN